MIIRPVGAELFRAKGKTYVRRDTETDRHDEANSRFSQFNENTLKPTTSAL